MYPKADITLNHHTVLLALPCVAADEPRLISCHPAPVQSTQHKSPVCARGHTALPRSQSLSQELFRLCTKSCSPVPARRASEGFLSLHPIRQDKSLNHPSPCSHSMALLAASSSWFTSCLSGEINPRSQGDKVGIIIKAAHEPCPYQTAALYVQLKHTGAVRSLVKAPTQLVLLPST